MVGDVNGDGFADLVCVSPAGDVFIDVALNAGGMKCLVPQRANSNWGKDCQAVCIGEFDEMPGADIVGIFPGQTLRLAHGFKDGSFKDESNWITLPVKLKKPHLAWIDGSIYAWDERSGNGFKIATRDKRIVPARLPKGLAHLDAVVAARGHAALFTLTDGRVQMGDTAESKPEGNLGRCVKGTWPLVANAWIFLDEPTLKAPTFVQRRPKSTYPNGPDDWAAGDMDGDGDADLLQFRYGSEPHTGNNVLLYRFISKNETDSDHDGLMNEEEVKLGTDPYNPDTDGDGLLDGWEVNGFRGLDMKALGCNPKRIDLICLVSRFGNAKKEMVEGQMKNIQGYYDSLGWSLHPVWLEVVSEADQKKPWWELRDKFLPVKWRGVAHWMQLTPWGGGQADQLGDGGGCGGNEWALYATFIHEFGHQLGLSHEGFYSAGACPIYPSMMNYSYSYGLEDDIKKIRYSDGALAKFVMKETDLDETLPLPFDKVKFLEKGPYHFRLRRGADNHTTLIDWNWNGVFGEKHVRADVNYSYSTTAGRRDEVDKTQSAPWVFTHGKIGYVLYAQHGLKADGKSDPTVSAQKPGWLLLRRLIKPFEWGKPVKISADKVIGDAVAVSYGGGVVIAYQTPKGVAAKWLKLDGDRVETKATTLIDESDRVPSLGVYKGRLFLFEWSASQGDIQYRSLAVGGRRLAVSGWRLADFKSTVPVSIAVDTLRDELVIGFAQDQDKDRPSRWCINRHKVRDGILEPSSALEWIEGEAGGARGRSRPILLFDEKGVSGMKGRLLYFGQGMTSKEAPWSCEYVAQTIGDKTIGGGWMVKRYYDEWTQSRSAPAACWFGGDILYAYRWVDGSQNDRDNLLHVAYNGTGIEDAPMGDFNDIDFLKRFGIRHSILYLRQ